MPKLEFAPGDIVTYQPCFGRPDIKARVTRATIEFGWLPSKEKTAVYELEGIDASLVTHTKGRSIKESSLYDDTPFSWED